LNNVVLSLFKEVENGNPARVTSFNNGCNANRFAKICWMQRTVGFFPSHSDSPAENRLLCLGTKNLAMYLSCKSRGLVGCASLLNPLADVLHDAIHDPCKADPALDNSK
jgi:hypothetical protein